MIHQP